MGNVFRMTSLTDHERFEVGGIKLLYVDCLQSVKTMSTAKLVKLTFDQSVNKLKNPGMRKQTVKEYSNNFPSIPSAMFKFSVITTNHVNLILTHIHSSAFQSIADTY